MTKTATKSYSLTNSSQKSQFFAVLMYALYGNPRYFKFKRKYQQYGPCFQTIFSFPMTMIKCVKLSFNKCAHFLLFRLLFTLWIYHFHCYSMSILRLYLRLYKDFFACFFSVHDTRSLSSHEQVCLMRLHFERHFPYHRGRGISRSVASLNILAHDVINLL